jgi:hypothetical protein
MTASPIFVMSALICSNEARYRAVVAEHGGRVGPWPANAEQELDRLNAENQSHTAMLIASPASILAECQAKSRALRTRLDDASLLRSLLDDLETLGGMS